MFKTAGLTLAILAMVGCDKSTQAPEKQLIAPTAIQSKPISIAVSDYPGSLAWQVALEKGWFKEAGVEVELKWFDYSSSLAAFTANKIDAVSVANGDNFMLSSNGDQSAIILVNSTSTGNDVIIAKPGINSLAELKGKTVAFERGLVSDLLFSTAIQDAKIDANQLNVVNAVTSELPQVFGSPEISAIAVWQPIAQQALKAVPGSRVIYDSSNKPGLIYDTLSVKIPNIERRKSEWMKIIQVWGRVANYINDPATRQDAVNIMAKRAGVDAHYYATLLAGTTILNLADNKQVFQKGTGLDSLYGSSYQVNEFNLRTKLYTQRLDVDSTIYPSLVNSLP
ncbi:NitT/TauT family transport system substrate-binding protein [Acinetobacter calcoaceticus]|uniref:NitT/TauT family transport system substrate-binding protein n=1 Tax=Acinetobacter calcoaceticus TaxID=471 RepID=A0A4R1XJZ2_ACICA|nr:NitT/TauT family transport system substrate-binding protein [Acinetobacter calcoaceticus]